MATNVAGYIANLGKSVSFSATDRFKKIMPASNDFVETNADLFKEVYSSVRNYKTTYTKTMGIIKGTKVYEAGEVLKDALIDDIKNGTLYNKSRIEVMGNRAVGASDNGSWDMDDIEIDMSFMDDDFDGDFDNEITKGDMTVASTMVSSNKAASAAVSMAIAKSSEYVVESNKTTTNLLYTQGIQNMRLLNNGFSSMNENLNNLVRFSNDNMRTFIDNSTEYYKRSTNLLEEQTKLLQSLVKLSSPEEKAENKKSSKLTYDDIAGSGVPDIKAYMQNVKSNMDTQFGMVSSFMNLVEDGNPLLELVSSPLQFIPDAIAKTLIPKAIDKSATMLDHSIENFFGSIMAKFNTMAKDDESNPIMQTIGKLFGVSNFIKKADPSKYEKGKVDWDGKSRKALIEVIPAHLSKIASLLSGKTEQVYDYDEGKFVDATSIEKMKKEGNSKFVKRATGDMQSVMDNNIKKLTFNSLDDKESLEEDIKSIFDTMYNSGKLFKANSKNEDDYLDYGVSSKNYAIFKAIFKNAPKHLQHQINSDILSTRTSESKHNLELEKKGDSITNYINNGFNPSEFARTKEDGSSNKYKSNLVTNNLLELKDGKGNNIFFYLQGMKRELEFIRKSGNGMGPGGSGGNISDNDTLEYTDAEGNINIINRNNNTPLDFKDVQIPDNNKKSKAILKSEETARSRERYLVNETKRRDKFKDSLSLLNISDYDDDKSLEDAISSSLKTHQLNEELKEKNEDKPSILDRLLKAKSLDEKSKEVLGMMDSFTQRSTEFFTKTISRVDERIYKVIYGDKHGEKDIKGFLDGLIYEMKGTFSNLNTFLDEKILTPLHDKLDVNSLKDLPSKILEKFGIDTKEISKTIKTYFFGDKESGEDGIFSATGRSIKETFKGAFENIKDSVSATFQPVTDKYKAYKERKKKFNNIDETSEEDADEVNENFKATELFNGHEEYEKSDTQKAIESVVGANREKYQFDPSIFEDPEFARDFDIYEYTSKYNPNNEKKYLSKTKAKLENMLNSMTSPNNTLTEGMETSYNTLLEEYTKRQSEFDKYQETNNSREKDNNSYYNSYYSDNLKKLLGGSSQDETIVNILSRHLTNSTKNDKLGTLTVDEMLNNFKEFSDKNSRVQGYSNVTSKFEELIGSNKGMTLDEILHLPKQEEVKDEESNSYDTDRLSAFMDIEKEKSQTTENIHDKVSSIATSLDYIVNIFKSIVPNTNTRPIQGPTLNNALLSTDEGRAKATFAQNIGNMIANWMHGETPEYDEGGYVDKTTVATIGEGEVVLTKDSVKDLSEIFKRVMSSIENKKGSLDEVAEKHFGGLLKLNKKVGGSIDLKSAQSKAFEDQELGDQLNNLSTDDRQKFSKIIKAYTNQLKKENTKTPEETKEDAKPSAFVQAGQEILVDVKEASKILFGDPNKEKSSLSDAMGDIFGNAKEYAPGMISGGLLGAGVSLMTGMVGGPLLGAAVGAGASLIKNNEKVQEWLFGEMVDNERQGGVIGKDTMKSLDKYLPDMKNFGITGGLASVLIPGIGPIGGIIAGSAIGFAKNNEGFQNALFGEENGLFKPETKEKIQKALPTVAIGAGLGLLAGPFGLLGNTMMGSALGFASTTDGFKNALFGKKNEKTGEYENGILPTIKSVIIKPLTTGMKSLGGHILGFVDKHMLDPLKSAFDPIKKDIQLLFKGMFDKIGNFLNDMFEKSFGVPLQKFVKDKLLKPVGKMLTFIPKMLIGAGAGLATLPFKAIEAYGNRRKTAHIKSGNADYTTADERIGFRNDHSMISLGRDKFKSTDLELSNMSQEDLVSMQENLGGIQNTYKKLGSKRKELATEMGTEVSKYMSYGKAKKVMGNVRDGEYDKANGRIQKLYEKGKISQDEYDNLSSFMSDKTKEFKDHEDTRENKERIQESMYGELRNLGLKDINKKNVGKYLNLIDSEIKGRPGTTEDGKAEGDKKESPDVEVNVEQRHVEIRDLIQEAINAIKGVDETQKEVLKETKEPEKIVTIDTEGRERVHIKEDGGYGPDMMDKSTKESIKEESKEDDQRNEVVNMILDSNGNNSNENGEPKEKKEGFFSKLMGMASGLFSKGGLLRKLLTGGGIALLAKTLMNGDVQESASELKDVAVEGVKKATGKSGEMGEESLGKHVASPFIRNMLTEGATGNFAKEALEAGGRTGFKKFGYNLMHPLKTVAGGVGKVVEKGAAGMGNIYDGVTGSGVKKFGQAMGNKATSKVVDVTAKAAVNLEGATDNLFSKGIDNIKQIGQAISSKIKPGVDSIKNSKMLTKTTELLNKDNIIKEGIQQVEKFITGIFTDPTVVKLLDKTSKGGVRAIEILDKLLPKLTTEILSNADNASAKMITKIAGGLSTGGLLNIAFAVSDFISGFNDAKNILGITEDPTLAMKISAALLKSVNGLFIITALVPEKVWVDIFMNVISPFCGETFNDLEQMRSAAKTEVDTYNKANGTKLSTTQYNKEIKKDKSLFEKAKDGFKTVTKKVGSTISTSVKKVGDTVSNIIGSITSGISNVFGVGRGEEEPEIEFNVPSAGFGNVVRKPTRNKVKGVGKGGSMINNFPYYTQTDPDWKQGDGANYDINMAGCGPSSVAMILTKLLGKEINPIETTSKASSLGLWNKNVGASHGMFGRLGQEYNVQVQDAGYNYDRFKTLTDQNIPIAISGTSGKAGSPYTSGGHIVTFVGKDAEGNYLINDPRGESYSKAYTEDQVKSGFKNAWAYGDENALETNATGALIPGTSQKVSEAATSGPSIENFIGDLGSALSRGANKLIFGESAGQGGLIEGTDAPTFMQDPKTGKPVPISELMKNIKKAKLIPVEGPAGGRPSKEDIIHQDLTRYPAITEEEINAWLATKKKTTAPFTSKDGHVFLNAAKQTGLDPRYILAHAAWESGWGTSRIAKDKNNYFGIGAFNSSPYTSAKTFNSAGDGILAGAQWIREKYTDRQPIKQDTVHKMIYADPKHRYAVYDDGSPNTGWIDGIAGIMGGAPYDGEMVQGVNSGGTTSGTSGEEVQEEKSGPSLENFMGDLGSTLSRVMNKMFGFEVSAPSPTSGDSASTSGGVNVLNSGSAKLNRGSSTIADEWFTSNLSGRKSSGYGPRSDPKSGSPSIHGGIDYAASAGTPIPTPVDGKVIMSEHNNQGFGNLVVLQDPNGYHHYFAHMKDKSHLSKGKDVSAGDSIGTVGTTGYSTGNHLHYEIRDSNRKTTSEPNKYLQSIYPKNGTAKTIVEKQPEPKPSSPYQSSIDKVNSTSGIKKDNTPSTPNKPYSSSLDKLNGKGGMKIASPKLSDIQSFNNDKPNVTQEHPKQSSGFNYRLLEVIVQALSKISSNTDNLAEIVKLLSQHLGADVPKETADKLKKSNNKLKNNAQLNQMLKTISKNSDPSNDMIMNILNQLAIE